MRENAETVRVVVVEDHALLAECLMIAMTRARFAVTTAAASDLPGEMGALLGSIQAADPRVVLLDLNLGRAGDGATLIGPLVRSGRKVLVITAATEPSRWGECLARGAHGVLPKTLGVEDLVRAVRLVVNGREVMRATDRAELIACWRRRRALTHAHHAHLDSLTSREGEVLKALARGRRVGEIARESYVSEATVRTQVKSILGKLAVNSQIAAVAIARDAGWAADR